MIFRWTFLPFGVLPLLWGFCSQGYPQPRVGELAALRVARMTCEYRTNPIGIDTPQPRLSWKLASTQRGAIQRAYQLQVAQNPEDLRLGTTLSWDSGKVDSDSSIQQAYQGQELESYQGYFWRVRVWDRDGRVTPWSETAYWEMGILEPDEWTAAWIGPGVGEDRAKPQPSPFLRKEFAIEGKVTKARVYVTSLGLYMLELNGQPVSDELLRPGWTSYRKRIQYQTYDVTDSLNRGPNVIGAVLGDGWYRGYIGFKGQRNFYGDELALLVQLRIEYEDGRVEVVSSSGDWKSSTGPILLSDIYNGEIYDARREMEGWSSPGFDDSGWSAVRLVEHSKDVLFASVGPPVRRIQEIRPKKIMTTPGGETVFDMGQNMVGWIRVKAEGPAGTQITLKHAEVLDQKGNLYTRNLRSAEQTVKYVLKGLGEEVYEPHFTFQGFRYVAVDGYPGTPDLDSLTGVVIHSDMNSTGYFDCSNPLINRLQKNIVWGQKGNFVDIPTDCPQRDERLGWTGDAQVFSETASFNMDVASFFTKWMGDLAADQRDDGAVPHVVPDVLGGFASTGWADASVIIPWTMYVRYGDRRLLETQYPSMVAWVRYMERNTEPSGLWKGKAHFGDWLSATYKDWSFPAAVTDKDFIAAAFYGYSTELLQRAAEALGKQDEAQEYATLFQSIRSAFQNEFVTPTGRLSPNSQTAYTLALKFQLLPEARRQGAVGRLVQDIRGKGNHISTGFLGTPYICHVLTEGGRSEVAFQLLNQDTYPSWLYPVKLGATTIWERWDGIRPDGSFQDAGMNSFNHYAYGAIGSWLYGVVAGIQPDPSKPGFKHAIIRPTPGGGLTRATARLESPFGEIESEWELVDQEFRLRVSVPPNVQATVYLPSALLNSVRESGSNLDNVEGVVSAKQVGDATVVVVGSGIYSFTRP